MKKQKLTPWFVNGEKPARKGVYQQHSGSGHAVGYQKWDGKWWYGWEVSPESAEKSTARASPGFQSDPWRGLASDPKAKK